MEVIECTATAGLLILSSVVFAPRGNAACDEKNPRMIKGIVTEFAWTNPQVLIYLEMKDDRGNVVHWACETVSPSLLVRAGCWGMPSS